MSVFAKVEILKTDEEDVEDNTKREKRVAVNNDAASIISAG
jgi:hypothetical protein